MPSQRPQPFDLSRAVAPEPPQGQGDDFELAPASANDVSEPASELPALDRSAQAKAASIPDPRGGRVYVIALLLSLAWLIAPALYAYAHPAEIAPLVHDPAAVAGLFALLLAPLGLLWIAAWLVQQGRRLAAEARRAQALAESLLAPTALAAREARSTVADVRREIDGAAQATARASAELAALRDALAKESERLNAAADESRRAAQALGESLSGERQKLDGVASALDARISQVSETITGHAKMVGEASDLAATQIREAEAALAARAADLAAAAGHATNAAKLAGDQLTEQVDRLETAGAAAGDQARAIEQSLSEQRAALVTTAHGMRADHESFAVEAEALRGRLSDIVTDAKAGAREIGQTAAQGADVLRQMIASTDEQLKALVQTAAEERDRFSAQAAQSLALVSELAAREREATEAKAREAAGLFEAGADEARKAAEAHVEAARAQLATLEQSVAAAKARADETFEARLGEARQVIEQSAHLVDEAGRQTSERLKEGVDSARSALTALDQVLNEIDRRLAQAPIDAEARTTALRENVERGIGSLMDSARQAAEETQNIDAAFQERVRRNYDMLSEAVRLMGVVAGAGSAGSRAAAAPRATQAPAAVQTPAPAEPAQPAPAPAREEPRAQAPAPPQPEPGPQPQAQPVERPAAEPPALRPRLKLTPTATDEEFKTVFEAAGGREPAGDAWTWKDLLSSMDKSAPANAGSPTPSADDGSIVDVMLGELEAMGLDTGAQLPRARVSEIAAAMKSGGPEAGREMVRAMAPAGVRRLARRVLSDRDFRDQADRYVRRYAAIVADAARREGPVFAPQGLLGSDQGRAYLLLDAAIKDAGG